METEAPLLAALSKVIGFLEANCVDYALVGGLALAIWGESRATYDVDVAVAADEDQSLHLQTAMRESKLFLSEPETLTLPPHTRLLRGHLADPASTKISVVIVDFIIINVGFSKSLLARRLRTKIGNLDIWTCSPEDLIVLKLMANREKDIQDIKGIMKLSGADLDQNYIREWSQKLGFQVRGCG